MDEAEFIELLRSAQRQLQRTKVAGFQRRVGLGDLVTDRAENAIEYGFGKGTTCYDSAIIVGDVSVGENCWIGPHCILDGTGGLSIGSWVTVSMGVIIASHSTVGHMLSGGSVPMEKRRTAIGDRVVVGPGAFVGMGVRIGERCVIAPHAVVTRNVPALSIVQGDPAKVIGKIVYDSSESPKLVLHRGKVGRQAT